MEATSVGFEVRGLDAAGAAEHALSGNEHKTPATRKRMVIAACYTAKPSHDAACRRRLQNARADAGLVRERVVRKLHDSNIASLRTSNDPGDECGVVPMPHIVARLGRVRG